MIFQGRNGKVYENIEPALGSGGEGTVYKITGMADYVLKVYRDDKRTETRYRKLLNMIATPLSGEAMKQVTWPVDIVYSNGQFAGFVMPAVNGTEELNVMYSDKYVCTFTERITIARNLCAAINAVHNAGQVCGDLNPKNIAVDPRNARVTLIDTDSYHISEKSSGRIYKCVMGLPEYLPYEIQAKMKNGKTLATAPLPTFTKQTDFFALAIHIFALLMNGCHPFACATANNANMNIGSLAISQPSVMAPQPIENICMGFFPFYEKRSGISTPVYAPEFGMLPQRIRDLFVRAFVEGHSDPRRRPNAVEWYNALTEMEKNITRCGQNKGHLYPSHLQGCPWCKIERNLQTAKSVGASTSPISKIKQSLGNVSPLGNMNNFASNKSTSVKNNSLYTNVQNSGLFASKKVFWIFTIIVPIVIQVLIHVLSGNMVVGEIFGYEYGNGIESWGKNLAIWIGPWGFGICGLAGTCLYNIALCENGKLYGYKWYHYVLSIVASFVAAAAWILVILAISLVIIIVAGILAIFILVAIIYGMIVGS